MSTSATYRSGYAYLDTLLRQEGEKKTVEYTYAQWQQDQSNAYLDAMLELRSLVRRWVGRQRDRGTLSGRVSS